MRILGIDPGMASCGLAVLEDGKLIHSAHVTTHPDSPRTTRLSDIHNYVQMVVANWNPDVVALEHYAMGAKFGREQMGEVGGAIKLALRVHLDGEDPAGWAPKSWMKLVCGSGTIAKDQIRLEIYKRYGVDLKTTHEVDAFGVAMAEHLAQTGAKRPRPKTRKEPVDAAV